MEASIHQHGNQSSSYNIVFQLDWDVGSHRGREQVRHPERETRGRQACLWYHCACWQELGDRPGTGHISRDKKIITATSLILCSPYERLCFQCFYVMVIWASLQPYSPTPVPVIDTGKPGKLRQRDGATEQGCPRQWTSEALHPRRGNFSYHLSHFLALCYPCLWTHLDTSIETLEILPIITWFPFHHYSCSAGGRKVTGVEKGRQVYPCLELLSHWLPMTLELRICNLWLKFPHLEKQHKSTLLAAHED